MEQAPASRRRGEELETAIFDAVWAELADVGYAHLTVEGVATRARTSKAVLYRRWPGRAQLVFAALTRNVPAADDVPDTGSLRSDVLAMLHLGLRRRQDVDLEVKWGLLADSARDPELSGLVRAHLVEFTRDGPMAAMLERAVARGEVDPDRLTERRISLPLDLVRHELMVHGSVTDESIAEIVDDVFLPLVSSAVARSRR